MKIRGFRIELGEIESVLMSYSGLAQGVVLAREDEPGRKRLVGYVVPAAGNSLEFDDLRSYMAATLPDYMVPTAFVALDGLPLNVNGKLDRKALPAPESSMRAEFVAPRTETEKILTEIWSEVLQVTPIGVEDNFFELGGDSLRRLQLTSRMKAVFGVVLTPRDIRTASTVSALAELVEEKILSELERVVLGAGE